ncbi:MAG TPA: C39 family peptidase [Patescibacteria group bacterium]|nr:C39 family peptidase [Patescibacteria group bacterium]
MIRIRLNLEMHRQPNDYTCGPTSLQAVYKYYGDTITLDEVIAEVPYLEAGGTLAVNLGYHALQRGYNATIYTYNLAVFDPSWFGKKFTTKKMIERLQEQMIFKKGSRVSESSGNYIDFLKAGGKLKFRDLTPGLLRSFIKRHIPILTGLSATYLYREMRERVLGLDDYVEDDVRGEPSGHFVVLCGYDREDKTILIADPLHPEKFSTNHLYTRNVYRVINSILLGILTYDANLLIIEPKNSTDTSIIE